VKKNLNFYSTVLYSIVTSKNLDLRKDLNVPTVSSKKKIGKKTSLFVGILKATEENNRIRIRNPVILIQIRIWTQALGDGNHVPSKLAASKRYCQSIQVPQADITFSCTYAALKDVLTKSHF
jgi:hypothetical protein